MENSSLGETEQKQEEEVLLLSQSSSSSEGWPWLCLFLRTIYSCCRALLTLRLLHLSHCQLSPGPQAAASSSRGLLATEMVPLFKGLEAGQEVPLVSRSLQGLY